jgi:hypothetical protein
MVTMVTLVTTRPRRAALRLAPVRLATATLAAATIACGEYARTNPYDPETKVTFTIVGPDTAWSLLQTLEFTASISPSLPGLEVEWASDDPTLLASRGGGTYQTTGTGVTTVIVRVGRHEGTHTVTIRQRPEQVFFRCAVPPCSSRPPVGQVRSIVVNQFDRLGEPMQAGQTLGTVSYVIRNPAVATIVAGSEQPTSVQVRGVAPGTTWIVATMPSTSAPSGQWIDSLSVVVDAP